MLHSEALIKKDLTFAQHWVIYIENSTLVNNKLLVEFSFNIKATIKIICRSR